MHTVSESLYSRSLIWRGRPTLSPSRGVIVLQQLFIFVNDSSTRTVDKLRRLRNARYQALGLNNLLFVKLIHVSGYPISGTYCRYNESSFVFAPLIYKHLISFVYSVIIRYDKKILH